MALTDIATFRIQHLQISDENGNLDSKLDPKLSKEQLLTMYRWMVLAREADERMLKLQRQGRIGTFALNSEQEAAKLELALRWATKIGLYPASGKEQFG